MELGRVLRGAVRRVMPTVLLVLFASPLTASPEYRLNQGDVIEFSVIAAPELKHRAAISLDGTVSLPLLGEIKAAGLSIAELRAEVFRTAPTKILRRRTPDGREYPIVISPEEITLEIVEYRPVYVNGDVSKPGSLPYRPGLNVRQAVALAGGYDIMRFRMNNPFMESADLRSEYETRWTEFAKERAEVLRLRAELAGKPDLQTDALSKVPIPTSVAINILNTEKERLAARRADLEKERAHLEQALQKEDSRIATLTEQLQKENEVTDADTEDYERVRELLKRGSVPITRVADARRLILLSSTRALQTTAQLAQVQRERQELSRKLQKVDDERRIKVLADLQTAEVRLATTRARLQGIGEKLVYTGMVKSQLVRGKGAEPDIVVFRAASGPGKSFVADANTDLLPGDVVEISLRSTLLSVIDEQLNERLPSRGTELKRQGALP